MNFSPKLIEIMNEAILYPHRKPDFRFKRAWEKRQRELRFLNILKIIILMTIVFSFYMGLEK